MNKTGIQYLDFTWNPTTGCTFGCPECWARGVAQTRLALITQTNLDKYFADSTRDGEYSRLYRLLEAYRTFTPTLHPERLDEPARRKKSAVVGVCFMGDWMDKVLDAKPILQIMGAADNAPQHTYIFLTKQPWRAKVFLEDFRVRPNWCLGFSARNQSEFDASWHHMARLAAAGWKVWVSLEPMQGPINLCGEHCFEGDGCTERECIERGVPNLSTVILGAQSGKNAVTLNLDWVRSIERQCRAAKIPFMFKQDNNTGKVVTLPELDGKCHTATAWSQP